MLTKSKIEGQPNPPFTATYTGFVNGDSASSLDSPVSLTSTASSSSPAGTYPIVASGAADANYAVTHANGILTVTGVVKINFQPASSPIPAGYLVDSGSVYANRGNGYTYGWSGNNTGNAFDRNSPLSPDQRYDTLIELTKSNQGNRWEIGLPNGTYQVYIVAGDPVNFNSVYRVNAEGLLTVSGTPTSSTRWISGTRNVTVNDGRLTITSGSGAKNNEICFIEITPATGLTGMVLREPAVRPALSVEANGDSIRLRLESASEEFTIETSTDLENWIPLAIAREADGSFSILSGKDQSFFRAVKQ